MRVEQLNDEGWAKTYLLIDENSSDVCLIDPVYDFTQRYLELIDHRNLTLKMTIATHTHADHITGCFSLMEETGCDYVMWKTTACMGVSKYVDEKSTLKFAFPYKLPLIVLPVKGIIIAFIVKLSSALPTPTKIVDPLILVDLKHASTNFPLPTTSKA